MALALTNCEAPNIVAAAGQEPKGEPGAGAAENMAEGFKKKLQDCVAMMIPMQQPTMSGSAVSADDGMQADPGMPGVGSDPVCILEGLEMPQHPTDVTGTPTEAAELPDVIPAEGVAQEKDAAQVRQPETDEPIAWTQNTTAGDTPVKTQDEILKAIGAYIEPTDTGKQSADGQTPLPNTANVSEGQENRAAATPDMTQKPAVAQAEENRAAAPPDMMQKLAGVQAEEKDAAAAPDMKQSPVAAQAEEKGAAADAPPAKREVSQARLPQEAVKPQSDGVMAADTPGTAPAASDTAVADAPEVRAEEAQYTRENVLRIVDKVRASAAEGRYDFDVELKPDFLGKVSIKLTMQDGAIRMQIKAEDMSVRSMLADQTAALQSALKDKGVTLTSVDVTYHSQASLDSGGQPFEQHNSGGRQHGSYYAQAETSAFEAATETYSYYVGNSSVEFLA